MGQIKLNFHPKCCYTDVHELSWNSKIWDKITRLQNVGSFLGVHCIPGNWLMRLLLWYEPGHEKTSAQSDQRLYSSLLRQYNTYHAYQSLAFETAINTDFIELFSLKRIYVKYKNAILLLIDSFFRIWKDKTYGQVLSQIFNYYGETRSQDRTNRNISESTSLYVSFFHVQKKQSTCDKIAFLYFT